MANKRKEQEISHGLNYHCHAGIGLLYLPYSVQRGGTAMLLSPVSSLPEFFNLNFFLILQPLYVQSACVRMCVYTYPNQQWVANQAIAG